MKKKYESLDLTDQEIIKIIDSYKSHSSLRRFLKKESINLSESVAKYARLRYLVLKRKEWRDYYQKNRENKVSKNKYLRYISACKSKESLEKYLSKDLNNEEKALLNKKLKEFEPKKKQTKKRISKTIENYKYLDIISRCNNQTTLRTYRTFTDLTDYEKEVINRKIKQLNQQQYKEQQEKSYIQREVEQQISYQKNKDKLMEEYLAKGGKIQEYDFGLED